MKYLKYKTKRAQFRPQNENKMKINTIFSVLFLHVLLISSRRDFICLIFNFKSFHVDRYFSIVYKYFYLLINYK